MAREKVENDRRMSLRARAEEKALLMRAVVRKRTGLTDSFVRLCLLAARDVNEESAQFQLNEK